MLTSRKNSENKKRQINDSSISSMRKKFKNAFDVTTYWKKVQRASEKCPKAFIECSSKTPYLIIDDPFDHGRSHFIISKTSFYWLKESIRAMQSHAEYISTIENGILGEFVEIEKHLKALKIHLTAPISVKTFFCRAEALLQFVRLCSTMIENPMDKYRSRCEHLIKVCANAWLQMFDLILPNSIVRVQKSFLLDDDQEDFQADSILKHYLKEDQKQIQKANTDVPNLCEILRTILRLLERFEQENLLERIFSNRFEMIYQIWMQIDQELNRRTKKISPLTKKFNRFEKLNWNFLVEFDNYEKKYLSNTQR